MTINLEEHNIKKEIKSKSKDKLKKLEKSVLAKKKMKNSKNKIRRNHNVGAFRNNSKNYQFDYEEDYYEPH